MDRMLSNYYYWMGQPDDVGDALVRKIKRERWSVEKMCFCPEFRNYQSMWLKGVRVSEFSFVGIVEEYERCLGLLEAVLGLHLRYSEINVTKQRAPISDYKNMAGDFVRYHRKDYELYEYAKRRIAACESRLTKTSRSHL